MGGITIDSLRLDNTIEAKVDPKVASQLKNSEGLGISGDGAEAIFAQFRDHAARQAALLNKANGK